MKRVMIGAVTAYADAVAAGYMGSREDFSRQQAEYAKNAASVEAARAEVAQKVDYLENMVESGKKELQEAAGKQLQQIQDAVPDLTLDREQIKENISGIQNALAAAEDARTIAKGRATGHVFDTVEDMEVWLQDEDNVNMLLLGDNLYIRATEVPDYWWDGEKAQKLETQKVDLSEYANKRTDYGKCDEASLILILSNRSLAKGIQLSSDGSAELMPLYESEIKNKSKVAKCALMPRNMDMTAVQVTHQEMSETYDPKSAITPDGSVPYNYAGRQPVSYDAAKAYVDAIYREDWKEQPVYEITVTEDCTSIDVDMINGESFCYERIGGYLEIHDPETMNTECRACLLINRLDGYSYNGIIIANNNGAVGKTQRCYFEVRKEYGCWKARSVSTSLETWTAFSVLPNEHWGNERVSPGKDTITSFRVMPYAGSFHPGTILRIYGKPTKGERE